MLFLHYTIMRVYYLHDIKHRDFSCFSTVVMTIHIYYWLSLLGQNIYQEQFSEQNGFNRLMSVFSVTSLHSATLELFYIETALSFLCYSSVISYLSSFSICQSSSLDLGYLYSFLSPGDPILSLWYSNTMFLFPSYFPSWSSFEHFWIFDWNFVLLYILYTCS